MTFVSARTLVAIVAAGCIALVTLLYSGQVFAAAPAKLISSTAFIALAVKVGGLQSNYGRLICLGLLFSWFGDAFLIGEARTFFLLGLGAFLLAHLAYITAFIVHGFSIRWLALAALPVAALAIAVSIQLAPHVPAELEIAVRLYTAVISLMVIAAIGTRGRGASTLILAGALMFFLSDLSVAALRLVGSDFPTYVWGLPLYYAGQTCLALSTSQSRSH